MTVAQYPAKPISVLIADSNLMQAQLLTSALRRRSEFRVSICKAEEPSILDAMAGSPAQVVVFSLNHSVNTATQMATLRRLHLAYPAIAKVPARRVVRARGGGNGLSIRGPRDFFPRRHAFPAALPLSSASG